MRLKPVPGEAQKPGAMLEGETILTSQFTTLAAQRPHRRY